MSAETIPALTQYILRELIVAASPFLVDDLIGIKGACPGPLDLEIWQCIYCGAHHENPEEIEHYSTCSGDRLRKAITAAEKVLQQNE